MTTERSTFNEEKPEGKETSASEQKTLLTTYLNLLIYELGQQDKGRPFDTKTYKNASPGSPAEIEIAETFKDKHPFAEHALSITVDTVRTMPEQVTLNDINNLRNTMTDIAKDLNNITLKDGTKFEDMKDQKFKKAITEGYIFNAFGRHINSLKEEAEQTNDMAKKIQLQNKAIMLRSIAKDFVNGVSAENYFNKAAAKEKEKNDNDFKYCITQGALNIFDPNEAEKKFPKLSLPKIELYGEIGRDKIDKFIPKSDIASAQNVRDDLAKSWAKDALLTQKTLEKDPFTAAHDSLIRTSEKNDEFEKLVAFSKDILTIQENYDKKKESENILKSGLKFFKQQFISSKSEPAIQNINNKLRELIQQYPEKTNKQIANEMKEFLISQKSELDKNKIKSFRSDLSSFIDRTITKLTAQENLEQKKLAQPVGQSSSTPTLGGHRHK